ncbi:MAG: hypothetical protein HYX28_10605 [Candidatus Koribacter versatilis]|uniref:Tetratricopeptide repeat protein n=1 Tax=Candidatus Korobacter versatilis TaxID=658062 RepID=A0A932AAC3_9BACT|nr:hypothetical protein [Candidatus Koribacter versatilis]
MPRLLRLCLALCALALPALAQDWIEVRSPNFVVTTSTSLSSGRAVALRFEQMRKVFGSVLQRADVRATVPLHILAFKTAREFQTAVPHGAPGGGLYVVAPDAEYALLDLSAKEPYAPIARDYARSVVVANTPMMPPWFDEGVAAYLATLNVGEKDVQLGRRPAFVDEALAARKLLPATSFLAVTRQSPEFKSAAYAAQSWLLVSWLLAAHRLPATYEYARLVVAEGLAPEAAFQQAFGSSPATLDSDLLRLLAARDATTSFALPDNLNDLSTYSYQDRKLAALDSQVAVADFHIHVPEYFNLGLAESNNIATQDPNNGGAHRSLGFAYLQKGDLEQAGTHLAKAAELSPNDPRVHYYSALLVTRAGEVAGGGVASFDIKSHLLKALDLDPAYADAWFLLGRAYETDDKWSTAIADVLKALRLAPRNDAYRLALARMYGEAKQWDDAAALLAYLKTSPDPEVARQAPQLAATLAQMRTQPARTGRFNERPRPSNYDAPKWRTKPATAAAGTAAAKPDTGAGDNDSRDPDDIAAAKRNAPPAPDARPILFLKGRLVAAACRPSGAATLTVSSGNKTVQLATPDYKKLVLIGADAFSCAWKNVSVAVNYRGSSPTTGDLVSLELQ